ncbi:MAG TPA: class I SAM-dependent methyltransferase [Candidatus Sulfotelmatobacter sp.]|nr:class I SAM-dependent methyltransferase [Candidatus Sulfotelmatobacter sp.]
MRKTQPADPSQHDSSSVDPSANPSVNLWTSTEHARDYLGRADKIAHRREGESSLLEFIPSTTRRILDLGTGDGRLLALVRSEHPETEAVAVDFSPAMLEAVRKRFAADPYVKVVEHNMDSPLPELGKFDAVVSSFAIHHLVHERKRALYAETYARLNPGGVFCNLEHVASPSPQLHREFLEFIGYTVETEDPSNKLLELETQLGWLREIGFVDVDCHWKWRELALLAGRRERIAG